MTLDVMNAPTPTHLSLDSLKKEIRLFNLEPSASFEGPLKCSIRIVSLIDWPQYSALSWNWGTDPARTEIELNGNPYACPKNLAIALRYFRDDSRIISFCADAICINQTDLLEKSHQIPLMGDIYSQAVVVRIWLGEAANYSDQAIRLIKTMQAGFDILSPADGMMVSKEQWGSLRSLLERPWWDRIWIVQEMALAQRVTLNCGHASFLSGDLGSWVPKIVDNMSGMPETSVESMIWMKMGRTWDRTSKALDVLGR